MSRYIRIDDLEQYSLSQVINGVINIQKLKTADVVEVVHGEWIKIDKRGKNVQCSKCGNTLDLRGVNAGRGDANYCPNCGARMDGAE